MIPGGRDPAQMCQRDWIDQPADGLDGGHHRGDRDHRHDEQPGQVLNSPKAVRVAAGGGPTAHSERDPQRHRGQRVGEVVHGVGEQGDRARDRDDGELRRSGDAEHDQADLDGPDACGAVARGVVDAVRVVVA